MSHNKTIIVTGINGQTGSYLAELLVEQGYEVHGLIRRSSLSNTGRINHILDKVTLHEGDLTDTAQINRLIRDLKPKEIYNLGAQSDVKTSFNLQKFTFEVNTIGHLNVLEAIYNHFPESHVYNAASSELFGGKNVPIYGFNENSPLRPRSPYAVSKLAAYWLTTIYREAYGIFAVNGICHNHESPRRGEHFVTKKITMWCGKYMKYLKGAAFPGALELGNLESFRDWGHAKDYVEAMTLMLRYNVADDWVVASGETHTVKEFINNCFNWMSLKLEWQGEGIDTQGIVDGIVVIKINPEYFRPAEVDKLLGDSSKLRHSLGWKPKFDFIGLIDDMMRYECTNG